MARISHVCISDLHSGADPSLATNVEGGEDKSAITAPSPTSTAFGAAVRGLLTAHNQDVYGAPDAPADKRAELILMGDLLDLAFSDRGHAGSAYGAWLAELTGGHNRFFKDDTVFLPGNHDHSLWTSARMAAEAASAAAGDVRGLESSTPAWQDGALPSPLITAINTNSGLAGTCHVRYPNYALVSDDKRKAVAFHHGHFIDSTYTLMSRVLDALKADPRNWTAVELAAENANWIDFGWSSFGETSDLSRIVSEMYTGAENGQEARKMRERTARMIEEKLVRSFPMGGDPRVHEALRAALAVVIDSTLGAWSDSERYNKILELSPAGLVGLVSYLEHALKPQLQEELGTLPGDLTFVFGHTHKPFVDEIVCPTGPVIPTVNTGGWYLDNIRLDSKDGAAMVFVSDALDVVSVRYFGVPTNGVVVPVKVELVSDPTPEAKAFRNQIRGYVNATQPLWDTLAETAAKAYVLRQQQMFELMNHMDVESKERGELV